MPVIAIITVYQCDGCKQAVIARDDDQRNEVHDRWFLGLDRLFCGHCRDLAGNQAAIVDEERRAAAVESVIKRNIEGGRYAN